MKPKPIQISGQIWHQPAYEGIKDFVYLTGDTEGKGGRLLFWVGGEVTIADVKGVYEYFAWGDGDIIEIPDEVVTEEDFIKGEDK